MKCPNCNEEFAYTWTIYFKSPFGRINCPLCSRRFRLKWSAKYFLILFSAWIIFAGLPAIGMISIGADQKVVFITFIGLGIMIVLPIDRILDQKILKREVIETVTRRGQN
jgi:hypothetical protein